MERTKKGKVKNMVQKKSIEQIFKEWDIIIPETKERALEILNSIERELSSGWHANTERYDDLREMRFYLLPISRNEVYIQSPFRVEIFRPSGERSACIRTKSHAVAIGIIHGMLEHTNDMLDINGVPVLKTFPHMHNSFMGKDEKTIII